jgi:hypothetical protein
MIYLLTECSIFVCLPECNSLLQISGKPISEEQVKVPPFNGPSKLSKIGPFINRVRILYGKSRVNRNRNLSIFSLCKIGTL